LTVNAATAHGRLKEQQEKTEGQLSLLLTT